MMVGALIASLIAAADPAACGDIVTIAVVAPPEVLHEQTAIEGALAVHPCITVKHLAERAGVNSLLDAKSATPEPALGEASTTIDAEWLIVLTPTSLGPARARAVDPQLAELLGVSAGRPAEIAADLGTKILSTARKVREGGGRYAITVNNITYNDTTKVQNALTESGVFTRIMPGTMRDKAMRYTVEASADRASVFKVLRGLAVEGKRATIVTEQTRRAVLEFEP